MVNGNLGFVLPTSIISDIDNAEIGFIYSNLQKCDQEWYPDNIVQEPEQYKIKLVELNSGFKETSLAKLLSYRNTDLSFVLLLLCKIILPYVLVPNENFNIIFSFHDVQYREGIVREGIVRDTTDLDPMLNFPLRLMAYNSTFIPSVSSHRFISPELVKIIIYLEFNI